MAIGPPVNRPVETSTNSVHWLIHIGLILTIALVWRGRGRGFPQLFDSNNSEPPVVQRGDLTSDELSTVEIYQRVAPSVVNVTSLAVQRDGLSLDEFAVPQGTGSGFVWDEQGYIVTNYHVLMRGDQFRVTLSNWTKQFPATVVGIAPDQDLAVLKIEVDPGVLKPVQIGTSLGLLPGQKVLAIGSPFELDQTLTTGVISGLGREIPALTNRPILGVIQTDAAINPGNSGGPLLDSAGLVIGVNAQIRSPTGANSGIGFAIPIDTVRRIVPQLIRTGKVDRIGLGIRLWQDQMTVRLGITGVLIRDVEKGGPADTAGLLPTRRDTEGRVVPGDLIVAADGKAVESSWDLYRAIDQKTAGESMQLVIVRGEKQVEIAVKLAVLGGE